MLFNFSLLILATMAASTVANDDLLNAWNIDDPTFGEPEGKTFTFKYGNIKSSILASDAEVTYYGFDCKVDDAVTYISPEFVPIGSANGVVRDASHLWYGPDIRCGT